MLPKTPIHHPTPARPSNWNKCHKTLEQQMACFGRGGWNGSASPVRPPTPVPRPCVDIRCEDKPEHHVAGKPKIQATVKVEAISKAESRRPFQPHDLYGQIDPNDVALRSLNRPRPKKEQTKSHQQDKERVPLSNITHQDNIGRPSDVTKTKKTTTVHVATTVTNCIGSLAPPARRPTPINGSCILAPESFAVPTIGVTDEELDRWLEEPPPAIVVDPRPASTMFEYCQELLRDSMARLRSPSPEPRPTSPWLNPELETHERLASAMFCASPFRDLTKFRVVLKRVRYWENEVWLKAALHKGYARAREPLPTPEPNNLIEARWMLETWVLKLFALNRQLMGEGRASDAERFNFGYRDAPRPEAMKRRKSDSGAYQYQMKHQRTE